MFFIEQESVEIFTEEENDSERTIIVSSESEESRSIDVISLKPCKKVIFSWWGIHVSCENRRSFIRDRDLSDRFRLVLDEQTYEFLLIEESVSPIHRHRGLNEKILYSGMYPCTFDNFFSGVNDMCHRVKYILVYQKFT